MHKIIYGWFTLKAQRTWLAHAIICILISSVIGVIAAVIGGNGIFWEAIGATIMMFLFWVKEAGDELKHKADGEWNEAQWEDRVTYSADRTGDLVGPFTVWAAAWASYGVQQIHSLIF